MYENSDPRCLDELVTGDETWLYYFGPLRKAMNKAWVPKGVDAQLICNASEKKVLYTTFFLLKGHWYRSHSRQERASWGSTTETVFFRNWTNTTQKKLNQSQACIKLLHDIAPAHKSKLVQEYLSKKNIQTLPHPPYSPDLAPCDIFLSFHV